MHQKLVILVLIGLMVLAACDSGALEQASEPTATLLPILSQTPRFTATPEASRTPLPTFTFTPSETPIPPTPTMTFTPSPTPPITGIVQSLNRVNVREGPDVSYAAIYALAPGTGLLILGSNPEGNWLNVRFEDDGELAEGWISATLVFIEDTPTPIPTFTPSPDLTAIALGTPLPTVLLGGGTVTPTPPGSVVTPTPIGTRSGTSTSTPTQSSFIPIIDVDPINATATALAGGVSLPTQPPISPTVNILEVTIPTSTQVSGTPEPSSTSGPTANPPTAGTAIVQESVRVFALCDNAQLGFPPPANLAVGSTIIVWWSWLAKTEEQIQHHLSTATYEVRVNGDLLTNTARYRSSVAKPANDYVVSWYVPYSKPLQAGLNRITYRVTWSEQITDGYEAFGPGTRHPIEEGSCTFTVR